MLSKKYLEMTVPEKAEYMAKVIILAQHERYFVFAETMVTSAEVSGVFDKVAPGDPASAEISDLDNPIENGIN